MREENKTEQKLDPQGRIVLPANQIPSFNVALAIQNGVEKNIIFRSWGGFGDVICSIPTVQYAIEQFSSWADISLASERPEFFKHLKFKEVFDLKKVSPKWENYLVFDLIKPPNTLLWEHVSHMVTNGVDFPTICALRSTLPIKNKEIQMTPSCPENYKYLVEKDSVFIHAGAHWASKRFPIEWWEGVTSLLKQNGITPILIGGKADDNRTFVNISSEGCVDLRDKISLEECVWLLQRGSVLITNDSAPLHMAATYDPREPDKTGECWIGFIATCKHPDFITHWRKGQWGYKMKNLGHGGMWEMLDHCPNKSDEVSVEFVEPEILEGWLPNPEEVLEFVIEKLSDK